MTDAGLDTESLHGMRAGSVVGTSGGESAVLESWTLQAITRGGLGSVNSRLLGQTPASQISLAVNRELGLTGEATTLSTACAAANYAIGYAFDQVRHGEADIMLAGGADSVCRWAHAGFSRLGALASSECKPFDRDRSGILTSEGSAMLVLESYEAATERGARIYAEILGYGLNCDALNMVAPDVERIAACIRRAHHNAGIKPDEVDYISAHGTGTPTNDRVEATAVRQVFGDSPPPISSIKSMLGHTMGAASGFGAIASAIALTDGFIPPTINFSTPDIELGDIDPVPNVARQARLNVVQNHGFGFGGNNAILVLGRAA